MAVRSDEEMKRGSGGGRIRRQVIVDAWIRLGRAPVSAKTLGKIQQALRKKFGLGGVESPASIARLLADEGAELRHPEVIEFDAHWREPEIEREVSRFKGLEEILAGKPLRFKKAEALIKKLEELRKRSETAGDQAALKHLRRIAVNARQDAQSLAKSRTFNQPQRDEQAELAEWLAVWIQTPNLFEDWLELRHRSPEFRRRFLTEKSS